MSKSALAAIHVGKKALGLDDETYRDLLERVTGKRSAGQLDDSGRQAVLSEMRRLGFAPKGGGRRRPAKGPLVSKMRALWLSLYNLGEVGDPSDGALAKFAAAQTVSAARPDGVQRLEWLDPVAADRVIKGLRGWCGRVGFNEPSKADEARINGWRKADNLPDGGPGFGARVRLIERQWALLIELRAMRGEARLDFWMAKNGAAVAAPHFLDGDQADRVIGMLGAWIRRRKTEVSGQTTEDA